MLEGELVITSGDRETIVRAGELSRVPVDESHGIRCDEHANVVQVRADVRRSDAAG